MDPAFWVCPTTTLKFLSTTPQLWIKSTTNDRPAQATILVIMIPSRDNQHGLTRIRTNSSSSSSSSNLASPTTATAPYSFYPPSPSQVAYNGSRNPSISADSDVTLPLENTSRFVSDTYKLNDASQNNSIRNVPVNSVATASKLKPSAPISNANPTPLRTKDKAINKAKMLAQKATSMPRINTQQSMASSKRNNTAAQSGSAGSSTVSLGRPIPEPTPFARPSRELERIASSMGGTQNALSPMNTGSRDEKHKHHHLVSFRTRKDAHPGVVLSSSSSNSKLISDQGSIYSFNPATPGMLKNLPALENKGISPKEDKEHIAEETWNLLKQWVLPLFNREGLRTPVEKVNFLVTLHLDSRIQQGYKAKEVLDEFKDLTKTGMLKLESLLQTVTEAKFLERLVHLWLFFFSQVLPYWEAVFLPLQLEFEGSGPVLSAPGSAANYWHSLAETAEDLSIRRMTLIAFRDGVILPVSGRLESKLSLFYLFIMVSLANMVP